MQSQPSFLNVQISSHLKSGIMILKIGLWACPTNMGGPSLLAKVNPEFRMADPWAHPILDPKLFSKLFKW